MTDKLNLDETERDWEAHFYEGEWTVDTLTLTEAEEKIIEELTTFLPRHMYYYDWNLPYAEEIILIFRRHLKEPEPEEASRLATLRALWTSLPAGTREGLREYHLATYRQWCAALGVSDA